MKWGRESCEFFYDSGFEGECYARAEIVGRGMWKPSTALPASSCSSCCLECSYVALRLFLFCVVL